MTDLGKLHLQLADKCAEIADLFMPGTKITVLVRNPAYDKTEPHSAATICSDDTAAEMVAAIKYCLGSAIRKERRNGF